MVAALLVLVLPRLVGLVLEVLAVRARVGVH